jgi:hypothetical protein
MTRRTPRRMANGSNFGVDRAAGQGSSGRSRSSFGPIRMSSRQFGLRVLLKSSIPEAMGRCTCRCGSRSTGRNCWEIQLPLGNRCRWFTLRAPGSHACGGQPAAQIPRLRSTPPDHSHSWSVAEWRASMSQDPGGGKMCHTSTCCPPGRRSRGECIGSCWINCQSCVITRPFHGFAMIRLRPNRHLLHRQCPRIGFGIHTRPWRASEPLISSVGR